MKIMCAVLDKTALAPETKLEMEKKVLVTLDRLRTILCHSHKKIIAVRNISIV